MSTTIHNAAVALGRKGGAAGTGVSKKRGDAEYYRKLSERAVKARRKNQALAK